MASRREISLYLGLLLAGISVLSVVSVLASERLLEGRAPEKRIRPLNIPDPHRPTSRPGIRKKSAAVRHFCFFRDLISEIFIFAEQIPLEQVVVDY